MVICLPEMKRYFNELVTELLPLVAEPFELSFNIKISNILNRFERNCQQDEAGFFSYLCMQLGFAIMSSNICQKQVIRGNQKQEAGQSAFP